MRIKLFLVVVLVILVGLLIFPFIAKAQAATAEVFYTAIDSGCQRGVKQSKPTADTVKKKAGKADSTLFAVPKRDTSFVRFDEGMGEVRCGVMEAASDGKHSLNGEHYTYFIKNFPTQIDPYKYAEVVRWAFEYWKEYSSVNVERTNDSTGAKFIVECGKWDGKGGVVQWAELPLSSEWQHLQKQTWFIDTADVAQYHSKLWTTAAHEAGHLWGGWHLPVEIHNGVALKPIMYMYVHQDVTAKESDKRQMWELYGHPPDTNIFKACLNSLDTAHAAYLRQYCRRNGQIARCATENRTCIDVRTDIDHAYRAIAARYPKLQINITRGYDCCAGKYDYHATLPLAALEIGFGKYVSPLFWAGLAQDTALLDELVEQHGVRAIHIRKNYMAFDLYERKNPNRTSTNGTAYFFDFSPKTNIR